MKKHNQHVDNAVDDYNCTTEERQVEATLDECVYSGHYVFRASACTILGSGFLLTTEFAQQIDAVDAQSIDRLGLEA